MDNFKKFGALNLGNTENLFKYLGYLEENIYDMLSNIKEQTEITKSILLEQGDDIICRKIGTTYPWFIIQGDKLKELFDDWDSIQTTIQNKFGETMSSYPVIAVTKNHIFKHTDFRREASVNCGLLNTEDSNTVFWDGSKIGDSVTYNSGELVLLNVKVRHSVIIEDYNDVRKFRAVLIWSTKKSYSELIKND